MLRYDPFQQLDRLTERVRDQSRSVMAFDAVRSDDRVTMYFDVPGVASDDLDVVVDSHELTVTAERRWQDDGLETLTQERAQGTFSRRVLLGDSLDPEQLEAELENGVLTISIPVSSRSGQRRVPISTPAGRENVIEAEIDDHAEPIDPDTGN